MEDLVNISIPTAAGTALLGYLVVFFGLVLLMVVLLVMGSIFTRAQKKKAVPVGDIPAPEIEAVPLEMTALAPGSAGDVKLYDTDPRTAAMLMAIVADELQAPLNELRFLSIREIKEEK